jgi:hypothetical protein
MSLYQKINAAQNSKDIEAYLGSGCIDLRACA